MKSMTIFTTMRRRMAMGTPKSQAERKGQKHRWQEGG
jgi:hypothetical protein